MTSADHNPIDIAEDNVLSDINQDITETYDRQVYTSNSFTYSSPGRLRAAAHLYGLESVSLEDACVLELGCAGGGNLMPFAMAYPRAQVVGVDLSSVQVQQGQQTIDALGIKNLQLHAMSLTDITPEFGQFDYIIAHGVFSWVPPEVREAMLRILRDNLSPNGIGYISYNTYPGWKAGDIVRDAMLLHSHNAGSDANQLASAKAMLSLLSDGIAQNNPLAPSLRSAVAQLQKQSDYYIAHEYLEIFNNPCYLLEFVNMADQHDLTHVGDSDPHTEMSVTYGQNVQLNHSLVALGQPREMRQQYLDFATGRNFRKSLVIHKSRADQVKISPDMDRLADLRWAGWFSDAEAAKDAPKDRKSFLNHKNRQVHTSDPTVIAVMRALSNAWPASLDFDSLLAQVSPNLSNEVEPDDGLSRKTVLDALQTLFRLNMLHYVLEPSPYDLLDARRTDSDSFSVADSGSHTPQDGPSLIPGAQYMYEQRQDTAFGIGMFNLWHDTAGITLKEAESFVLRHIDGSNGPKKLSALLRDALHRGTVPDLDGKSLKGRRNLDAHADKIVRDLMSLLRRQALIV